MKFKALVMPVFISTIACILAFIAIVIFAVHEQDKTTLNSEKSILQNEFNSISQNILSITNDNAFWDFSVEKVHLQEDLAWAATALCDSTTSFSFIDGVIIIRPDGSVMYSCLTEGDISIEAITSKLANLTNAMNLTNDAAEADKSGYINVDGQIVAYGASMVRPNGRMVFNQALPDRLPTYIFFGLVTQDRITAIGDESGIDSLTIDKIVGKHPHAVDTLYDYEGNIATSFNWHPDQPGKRLIKNVILPSILLLLIVGVSLAYFMRQAIRTISQMDAANKAKTSFLASMSHEIRTPLNSILGFSELVGMEIFGKVEGEKNKEYLELIKSSGHHLLAIINDILDLSKLEAGKFVVYAEKIDLHSTINNCVQLNEPGAIEKNITINCICDAATVNSDERIIRQVLLNILSNALKFTGSGGTIKIVGVREDKFYRVTIEDTGIGMTDEQVQVAMSPFGQIEGHYERSHTGTGLGLPLVDRFMALLEGKMFIKSTPNVGTTVTLRFPYDGKRKDL